MTRNSDQGPRTDDDIDDVDAFLEAFDECLDSGDLAGAREALGRAEALAADDPEVRVAAIELAHETDGPERARALAEALTESEPDHPDAWYVLGNLRVDAGDEKGAIACFERVIALDAEIDRTLPPIAKDVLARIERVAREVVEGLPPELGDRLVNVPIVLEERPSIDIVRAGFDPRSFGLFEGNEEGTDRYPTPTRIVLYTSCLVDAFGDGDELDEQVEITVLHEIGHFFHLDEDDVARLGLA